MSTEDRLRQMMSTVGQNDVDPGSWSAFVVVAHRDHVRYRIVTVSAGVAALAVAIFGTSAILNIDRTDRIPSGDNNPAPVQIPKDFPSDCPGAPKFIEGELGTVAYLGATELHVVDVATGEDSVLVQGGEGFGEGFFSDQVLISPDAQWVSFGGGLMVPTAGGEVCAPLGEVVSDLQWTPDGRAVALRNGSLIVGGPGRKATTLEFDPLPEFWSMVLSHDGERAAVAAVEDKKTSIWVIDLSNNEVARFTSVSAGDSAEIEIAGWDAESRWVFFWTKVPNSESLDADGSPLSALEVETGEVVPITDAMISERDQLAWCRDRLVFTDGGGRFVNQNRKSIAEASPPLWNKVIVGEDEGSSYVDPSCDDSGDSIAAIAVPLEGGPSEGSLVSWEAGSDVEAVAPPEAGRGFRFPQYSRNGDVTVLEYYQGESDPELIVLDNGMRSIGDITGQPVGPMLEGSPRWFWHRP